MSPCQIMSRLVAASSTSKSVPLFYAAGKRCVSNQALEPLDR